NATEPALEDQVRQEPREEAEEEARRRRRHVGLLSVRGQRPALWPLATWRRRSMASTWPIVTPGRGRGPTLLSRLPREGCLPNPGQVPAGRRAPRVGPSVVE